MESCWTITGKPVKIVVFTSFFFYWPGKNTFCHGKMPTLTIGQTISSLQRYWQALQNDSVVCSYSQQQPFPSIWEQHIISDVVTCFRHTKLLSSLLPWSVQITSANILSSDQIVGERGGTAFPFRFWRGNAVSLAYRMTATYNTSNRKNVHKL